MKQQEASLFDINPMTLKEKKQSFEVNTNNLKSIIKQADSSGKAAWTAGQILKELKEKKIYKVRFDSFAEYVEEEFRINELTANTYIKINECFDINEIGDLIVSNLKVIADIQQNSLRKEVVKAFLSHKSEDYKVKEVIAFVELLDIGKKEYNQNEVQELVRKVIQKANKEKEDDKLKRKNLVKFGKELYSESFPELKNKFLREPIDEMGVVALFCVVFDHIRTAPFILNNVTLCLQSIKYVSAPFPDACIVCNIDDKKKSYFELLIEFEYRSFEYIIHKHHKSPKANECQLIICWEDNARSVNFRANSVNVKNLPPIIELKNFLETGKINLI